MTVVEDRYLLTDPWTLIAQSRMPAREVAAGVAKSMRSNQAGKTQPELRLRSALHTRGRRFRVNERVQLSGRGWTKPDLAFTRLKLAVYVDGCYWHRCPEHATDPKTNADYWLPKLQKNVERDMRVTEQLRAAGWTVLRIWEHYPVEVAVEMVEDALARLSEFE